MGCFHVLLGRTFVFGLHTLKSTRAQQYLRWAAVATIDISKEVNLYTAPKNNSH